MKWIRLISLVTVCWACLWAASMAAPNAKESQWQQWHEQLEAQKKAADELKADNKELLDRLKAQETALLETQRKGVDWWLSAIGVGLTILGLIIAVGGILLPLYWQRSERRRLAQAQAEFARMNAEATGLLTRLQSHEAAGAKAADDASKHAESSRQHAQALAELREKAQNFEPPSMASSDASSEVTVQTTENTNTEAAEAAQQLSLQAEATETDKLRARAIKAASMEKPNDEQALEIYELWHVLTVLNPDDSNAQFNSGYWAQDLYKRGAAPVRNYWFDMLGKHYQKALQLNKSSHAAAFNWGNALAAEAQAVKGQDLPEARALWKAAGEQYARALQIKPDKHEAANNWGNALAAEAQAVKKENLPEARALWKAAGEQYARALQIKPDKHEAANNWGNALAAEAQAVTDEDLPAARALWKAAGEQYARALQIKPDMHEAASNWGIALAAEARAVKDENLPEARALWKAAGEQYTRALQIKPDKHEAANNWGNALAAEAQAVTDENLPEARALWKAAGEQYTRALEIKPDKHAAAFNWGSALDDAAQAEKDHDLAAARVLWKAAGEQYARALQIKPDMHEAAKNWGSTLVRQYDAFSKAQGSVGASDMLESAIKLLESHGAKYPESIPHLAYNLARAYACAGRHADALKQLEISSRNGLLPSHWREDEDLAGLRSTTEYAEWAETQHASGHHQ